MARSLNSFPPGGKARRLPDEWFDGSIWEITPGLDLRSPTPEKAKKQLMHTGRERGFWMRAQTTESHVYIQAEGRRW